jgi:glycosyltransferase involved in cell wall biosynthesis
MRRERHIGRVRVMRIVSRLNIGGPSIHVVLLNGGLDPARYDSLLVAGTEGAAEGNLKDLVTTRALRLHTVPELGREIALRDDLRALIALYRLMRRERPHIVHTHLAKAGFVGRLAARLAGVPIVLHTFHGHTFHSYFSPAKTRIFLVMERFCARLSDRIVTISDRLRDEIAAFGVARPEAITVIPLGFDLTPFREASRGRRHGRFQTSLGLPDDAHLIGIVGRLVPIKNVALFLEAAARAAAGEPRLHFAVVGDGDLRLDLEARARSLGLAGRVHFVGWRRDLPDLYADLDALVISSDNEGTPVSLIEAMATGTPAIATCVGGVPDVVVDGVTGRLVPPGDADALAAAMLDLVARPGVTAAMAIEAQQGVLARYRGERLVDDIDRLYRELLAAKRIQPVAVPA